ncbi:hypothetical protein KVR01_006364 [Diaporthe batatas]|uniref:uncharacterized protein n=1 Tax=Diaporthe batatas TaxID=748121 RepID=UPI001D03EF23|nr:uncharacterized protein KVR01_006364 [Diaporthe batatas]KAG8164446.1 hypothetical protein KVR01_006364 [Diaporthe batatas]
MDTEHDILLEQIRQFCPELPAATAGPITLWAPKQDPDRPSLPYIPGFTVQIEPHEAPPPFGDENDYGPWPRKAPSDLETTTQSALVVSHPPLEADSTTPTAISTPQSQQEQTAQLAVSSYIRVGCGHGAQIVRCTVSPPGRAPLQAVAKIFDALYYRFTHDLARIPRDVTARADMDYTREVAAYKRLMSCGETGRGVPEFYGSWTFKLPITIQGVAYQRPVRVLLIEHIEGLDLHGSLIHNDYLDYSRLDAFHLPEDYRLEVLARLLDIHARCMHWGVNHGDLDSRHVMLVADTRARLSSGNNASIPVPRVVLVDFNVSTVYSCTLMGKHRLESLAYPVNPMELFWDWSLAVDFEGWAPREWQESERFQQEWLLRRFGGEEQSALYEPVTKELKFSK